MIYKEVSKLLESEDGLNELLISYSESFAQVEKYNEYVKKGGCLPDSINKIQLRTTALKGVLNAVYLAIDGHKTSREGILFAQLRNEFQKKSPESKFNASATTAEISALVSKEREVRNWFLAYKEMAEGLIISCQAWLKHYRETYDATNKEQG